MLRQLKATRPPEVTVRLAFAPAEAAQEDFSAGPVLMPGWPPAAHLGFHDDPVP
jgi:hypothetical protein